MRIFETQIYISFALVVCWRVAPFLATEGHLETSAQGPPTAFVRAALGLGPWFTWTPNVFFFLSFFENGAIPVAQWIGRLADEAVSRSTELLVGIWGANKV